MKTTPRLEAAKAALKSYSDSHDEITAEIQRIEQGAQPALNQASTAQSLRQSLRSRILAMLRLGKVDTNDNEVKTLTKQIAYVEQNEIASAVVLEAKNEAIAELNAQIVDLNSQLRSIDRELKEARHEVAAIEIKEELVPRLRAAAKLFSDALGELAGAGIAHCELSRELQLGSLGNEHPRLTFDIHVVGFDISDTGHYNILRIDASHTAAQAKTAARERWFAA